MRELPAAWVEFEAADAERDDTLSGDNATGDNATGGEALEGGARRLRLSDPEGLLFSNDAISTVFARLEERLEATARRDARASKKNTKKGEQWA